MKKTLYSVVVGALTASLLIAAPTAVSAAVYTEGFDTVSPLPTGWSAVNNSSPFGSTTVFQGNDTIFSAHEGGSTAYLGMNFNSASSSTNSTISTWLITPKYADLSNGDAWSFYTRIPVPSPNVYPDRLEVRMSTNGSCDPGTGSASVGDFTTILSVVNPDLTTTGYPQTWTKISGELSGIKGAKAGCLAFRYYVPLAGPTGVNSDYIGIDTYAFDDQPADTTAPDTSIESGPTGTIQDATATFEYTADEVGSTFECSLDDAEFGPCSGPGAAHTIVGLLDGPHTFSVRATDLAGNPDPTPATRTFTVDTTAPEVRILTGPGGDTRDTTASFTFESSEAGSTFECSMDEAAFGPCSGPDASHTTANLGLGQHTFAVRATDAVGNSSVEPATRSFTVLAPAVVTPKPKVCAAEKATLAKSKTALTKANSKLRSANKSLKSAKKALKSAKKHKKTKAISTAKKKVKKAVKKVKSAKLSVKKAKRSLTRATTALKSCQR